MTEKQVFIPAFLVKKELTLSNFKFIIYEKNIDFIYFELSGH